MESESPTTPEPIVADVSQCDEAVSGFLAAVTQGCDSPAKRYRNMAYAYNQVRLARGVMADQARKARLVAVAKQRLKEAEES